MNRTMITLLSAGLLAGAPLLAAEGEKDTSPAERTETEETASSAISSTELRNKVRGMRKQVLGGGTAVLNSEKAALKFYRGKIQDMARHADDLRTQRDSKDAEYRVALDTTLKSEDAGERADAARTARRLKQEIRGLDSEIAAIEKRGESLGRGVAGIQRRIDKRKRVLSQFDREDLVDDLPYLDDEVLGDDEGGDGVDPFSDEDFVNDLLESDPEGARRLLFEADPIAYFKRFPIKPSGRALKKALAFPPADLPGQR
jgi:hypothetical protein